VLTTDPNDPKLKQVRPDGQQEAYLVLSDEERAKGFVRPVRTKYRHVGRAAPKGKTRPLTDDERERYKAFGYALYEEYDPPRGAVTGRFWTRAELDGLGAGCGSMTTMGQALAETYARDPSFYGGTFCCACEKHFPLRHPDGTPAFVWESDGSPVGS
jgi:hypothetical protein